MRILMANKYLYPRAGAETYMLRIADELIKMGYQVGFFGMDHPGLDLPGPVLKVPPIEFGRHLSRTEQMKNIVKSLRMAFSSEWRVKLFEFVEEFQPDVIHAHNIYNQISPGLFKEVSRKFPVIMTAHDYKPVCPNYSLFVNGKSCTKCLQGSYLNCARQRCVQKSFIKSTLATLSAYQHEWQGTYHRIFDKYIAPSHFMKDRLIEGGIEEEKVVVLHNFAEERVREPIGSSGLFYFGRLCEEKGVDTLIRAYLKLPVPRPQLTIAGTGPLETELKQLAGDQVRWLGHVSREEVERELDACGAAVVPSRWYENCSMAILEAFTKGRCVIASHSGGNPELVKDGVNGRLFPAGDVEALSGIIQEVCGDQESLKRLGKNAENVLQEQFSLKKHLFGLERIYRDAVRLHH